MPGLIAAGAPPAWFDAIWSVADPLWNDPAMTPEAAIAQLRQHWAALGPP